MSFQLVIQMVANPNPFQCCVDVGNSTWGLADLIVEEFNERFNQTLAIQVVILTADHQWDWDDHLPLILLAYWTMVQESTGCTHVWPRAPDPCRPGLWKTPCCGGRQTGTRVYRQPQAFWVYNPRRKKGNWGMTGRANVLFSRGFQRHLFYNHLKFH